MSDVDLPIDSSTEPDRLRQRGEGIVRQLDPLGSTNLPDDWPAWREQFSDQRRKAWAGLLGGCKSEPLLWGLPEAMLEGESADLVRQLSKAAAGKKKALAWAAEALPNWLAEAEGRPLELALEIECLAWCHAAPALAAEVEAAPWLELMATLLDRCDDVAGVEMLHAPLVHQLLAGELAVTLGYRFPQFERLHLRAITGRKALAAGILELLDGEGLPQAEHLNLLRPLIACWSRAGTLCRELEEPLLIDETRDGFAWAVQQMLRLTRADGRQPLDSQCHHLSEEFVRAAVGMSDDRECRVAAKLGGYFGKKKAKSASHFEAPPAGAESEWAAVAVLRSGWTERATSLVAIHPASELQLELNHARETIFSGSANPRIEIDGQPLQATGQWEQVCWQADDDVDYLELEIELAGGWTLQRQMLLAREDCFVMICDAVLCPEENSQTHDISYRCDYPLAGQWRFTPAEETAEGTLDDAAGQARVLILPLSLPEWRGGVPRGKLSTDENNRLVLQQQQRGSRLFAPLFIDLYSRRMRKQVTWRQLTVADQLQIQPSDVAVGYRVQLGLEQWLIYRSLDVPRNRTVLGHNLTTEFLLARFDDGETDELLEIE